MVFFSTRIVLFCACLISSLAYGGQAAPPPLGQKAPDAPSSSEPVPPKENGEGRQQLSLPLEFESHGLDYQSLTRSGVTVMYAPLPPHIRDFNIIQVTVTNATPLTWTVRPGDFSFVRPDGVTLVAVSADDVVESLLEKASRTDVIKLQMLYEASIYALSNFRSSNGYEQRREAAMAQFVNPRFKAAAAASAITLAATKLRSGDSTDGAVFFENHSKDKALGSGRLVVHTCGQSFSFSVIPEVKLRQ
jgi:hypothetical protein